MFVMIVLSHFEKDSATKLWLIWQWETVSKEIIIGETHKITIGYLENITYSKETTR